MLQLAWGGEGVVSSSSGKQRTSPSKGEEGDAKHKGNGQTERLPKVVRRSVLCGGWVSEWVCGWGGGWLGSVFLFLLLVLLPLPSTCSQNASRRGKRKSNSARTAIYTYYTTIEFLEYRAFRLPTESWVQTQGETPGFRQSGLGVSCPRKRKL